MGMGHCHMALQYHILFSSWHPEICYSLCIKWQELEKHDWQRSTFNKYLGGICYSLCFKQQGLQMIDNMVLVTKIFTFVSVEVYFHLKLICFVFISAKTTFTTKMDHKKARIEPQWLLAQEKPLKSSTRRAATENFLRDLNKSNKQAEVTRFVNM